MTWCASPRGVRDGNLHLKSLLDHVIDLQVYLDKLTISWWVSPPGCARQGSASRVPACPPR
eukprot:4174247-Amphidinium_carterae.1